MSSLYTRKTSAYGPSAYALVYSTAVSCNLGHMNTVPQIMPAKPQETLASRLRREFADYDPVVRLAGLAAKLEAVAFDEVLGADNVHRQVLVNDVAAQLAVAAYAKVATYVHAPAEPGQGGAEQAGVNPHAAEASRRLIERSDRLTDAVRGSGRSVAELARDCEATADRARR